MTAPETQSQEQIPSAKPDNKELNFGRQQRMYERMIDEKNARIAEMEKALQAKQQPQYDEDDDDDEPVDRRKLQKHLQKFGQQTKQETQTEIQRAVQIAIQKKDQDDYIKRNPDFYQILEHHAERFAQKDPELAETILTMPEGFERQKLVYKNIKALGIDKPETKQTSIQETIDQKKRSPYYQPTGMGSAPYSTAPGDFSPTNQKNAYDKMQELKNRLRI